MGTPVKIHPSSYQNFGRFRLSMRRRHEGRFPQTEVYETRCDNRQDAFGVEVDLHRFAPFGRLFLMALDFDAFVPGLALRSFCSA